MGKRVRNYLGWENDEGLWENGADIFLEAIQEAEKELCVAWC